MDRKISSIVISQRSHILPLTKVGKGQTVPYHPVLCHQLKFKTYTPDCLKMQHLTAINRKKPMWRDIISQRVDIKMLGQALSYYDIASQVQIQLSHKHVNL